MLVYKLQSRFGHPDVLVLQTAKWLCLLRWRALFITFLHSCSTPVGTNFGIKQIFTSFLIILAPTLSLFSFCASFLRVALCAVEADKSGEGTRNTGKKMLIPSGRPAQLHTCDYKNALTHTHIHRFLGSVECSACQSATFPNQWLNSRGGSERKWKDKVWE